ncbi:DUF4192 domain-containing protein [Streptomyces dangxiongensis]|uniref:DUF4192 domain-containing protein n=1 Tax=Streptomyces dangxiongensis TaxID=1442032 RepID=A0A3G2JA46_9ACTN|nr:DUF4192 domain-containing protein [Streptomyces dangxiongensis]AYN39024.1 DUF4192 domain-containing protein [Streptomyces dangxiongensis]
MTNHSETTGPFENSGIPRQEPFTGPADQTAQVTLRTPAELADALPYLLGYRPEDSMVLVALHDHAGRGRFGGRARLGIPGHEEDWEAAARQLARGLVTGSERRGARPERMVAYVCQEPGPGESGRDVKRRLGRLAHLLRTECGSLDVPVIEALCISDGRFWSYCCAVEDCCPEDGSPMGLPGTSVLAAAATYAGLQVRGTLRELHVRLQPWETTAALEQEIALDTAGMTLVPRILDETTRPVVAQETLDLAERIIRRYAAAAPVSGTHPADVRDDDLLGDDEAAMLILGLQDRTTRDQAAAWMEGEEAGPALRLWRALARRCVGPYGEHAAAPLTLAGWVAWSTGDELEAREALAMALGADPDYLFARLLHQACNEGLDPESIRRCLRAESRGRTSTEAEADPAETTEQAAPASPTAPTEPSQTPAPRLAASAPADAEEAAPSPRAGTHRRRRARSASGEDSRHATGGTAGRRRPVGSRPRSFAPGPTRPGTRTPSATRTRAAGTGDAATSGSPSESGRPEPEVDG